MAEWLDSTESWPRHPKGHWRETLTEARAAGWFLAKWSDHGWGKIACKARPDEFRIGEVCEYDVDGTATGGSWHAKLARQRVRSCPHRDPEVEETTDGDRAQSLLRDADRTLDGAERLVSERRNQDACEALVQEAIEDVDRADELLGDAQHYEAAAEDDADRAAAHFAAASYEGQVDPASATEAALDLGNEATALTPTDRDDLVSNASAVRDRAAALMDQIRHL